MPRHRAHQARRGRGRADPDVRRAGAFRRILSRAADQGGQPRRHCRADRKSRRSAQGARLQGAGRARDHPPGHAGHADRGNLARILVGQLAGGDRARRRRLGDRRRRHFDRPVRAGRAAARASLPPSSRACRLRRRSPEAPVPGTSALGRQGRVRQPRRRARAQEPLRAGDARRTRLAIARRARRCRRPPRLSRRDRRKAPESCSTRRAGSAARRTWRSTPRRATASS